MKKFREKIYLIFVGFNIFSSLINLCIHMIRFVPHNGTAYSNGGHNNNNCSVCTSALESPLQPKGCRSECSKNEHSGSWQSRTVNYRLNLYPLQAFPLIQYILSEP